MKTRSRFKRAAAPEPGSKPRAERLCLFPRSFFLPVHGFRTRRQMNEASFTYAHESDSDGMFARAPVAWARASDGTMVAMHASLREARTAAAFEGQTG